MSFGVDHGLWWVRSFSTHRHRLEARLPQKAQNEAYSFTRSLHIRLEFCEAVILDLLRKTPSKPREDPGFCPLNGFPFGVLRELNRFLHLHNFNMVQIFCDTSDDLTKGINLALLNHPGLGS